MTRQLHFSLETLEKRLLLAGNIKAFVSSSGDLIMKGNCKSNDVVVSATSDGFMLAGVNGTTINGESSFSATGVTGGMNIRLRGGSDTITLQGGSNGAPEFGFDSASASAFAIEDRVTIKMGCGDDTVSIVGENEGGVDSSIAKSQNDSASLRVAELDINMSSGSDHITMLGVNSDNVILTTGGGSDQVELRNNTNSGGGDDDLDFATMTMQPTIGIIDIKTQGGSDDVCISGTYQTSDVTLNGGCGTDTFRGTSSVSADTEFTKFEELAAICDDVEPVCEATIAGTLWRDNGDGIRDEGVIPLNLNAVEPGISGIRVLLLDATGNVVETAVTDELGDYTFSELCEGSFSIQIDEDSIDATVSGFAGFSPADQGDDDTIDSDVDATGRSNVIFVASGNDQLHLDAGLTFDVGPA